MVGRSYPKIIGHWIRDTHRVLPQRGLKEKRNPATGRVLAQVLQGGARDVSGVVSLASSAFPSWSSVRVVERADILHRAARLMQEREDEIVEIVHIETGKSRKDARMEVQGAIALGFFMSGEGRRYYGRTTTSGVAHRSAYTIRQPVGVCALIVPFNTPIANVAWKAFPALLCGNTCVLKAASDTPFTPIWFADILRSAGLPRGVFSVLQGSGEDVGMSLVSDARVSLVSFTGSTDVGRQIQRVAADRVCKVSLELGGKNAFVVCDDADFEKAVDFAVASAFSNAGQRCSSASRIIVFSALYSTFTDLFVQKTRALTLGARDRDAVGPVINARHLESLLSGIAQAKREGARVLFGGTRYTNGSCREGYFMTPTILEHVSDSSFPSTHELFGPLTCLYQVRTFSEALRLVHSSAWGLTAAFHSSSIHRIQEFISACQTGVVSINGPTYGSEPHMPFGGTKLSGNGFREPGTEALDVYSEWKTVYILHDPNKV